MAKEQARWNLYFLTVPYVDFKHLFALDNRGVFWVTRAKDNLGYEGVGQHSEPKGNIISDELIVLTVVLLSDFE